MFGSVRFSLVQFSSVQFSSAGFQVPRHQSKPTVSVSASDYPPLHHAHVLPSGRHQVAVVVQEGDVGHVAAVAAVSMAGSLERQCK